jgi:hypothetical protein
MSFLTSIFGAPSQEEADALDAKLRAYNEETYGPGGRVYNRIAERDGAFAADSALQVTREHEATQQAQDRDIEGQVNDAFGEGLAEGAANIRHSVDKGVFGTLKALLSAVPISVWVAAAVFGFIYFGGWALVSRRMLRNG